VRAAGGEAPPGPGGRLNAGSAAVADIRKRGIPEPSFRSIFRAGAPRFAREAFGPVVAFYLGWKLSSLVTAIVLASAVGIVLDLYERRRGRVGALALVSVAFVVVQALIGLIADSAVVYLAQPVLVSAIWGVANIGSVLIGRPLAGVFADAWYPFPPAVKASRTYRRVFGIESVVWGVYLLARSGVRMLALATESIGAFIGIQIATGVPFTIVLVAWSVWYASRTFERSTEWDEDDPEAADSPGGDIR
jgi:intracellular septation protein A